MKFILFCLFGFDAHLPGLEGKEWNFKGPVI
jgi:hypothetical protein